MTPEAQRIALAEACGFKWPGLREEKDIIGWTLNGQYIPRLPDYLNDLNAVHEAEKGLTDDQWNDYADWLRKIAPGMSGTIQKRQIHATAAQKSEALCRTLNLWRDDL